MEIRESQIEDILVGAPALTREILQLEEEPRVLVRQMLVPSGRIDMLCLYQARLLLLELKVVPFQRRFVEQLVGYRQDVVAFQESGKLPAGEIVPFLLCIEPTSAQRKLASGYGVACVGYQPEYVLEFFYQHFRPISAFTEVKPADLGIWNIHLIHDLLYALAENRSVVEVHGSLGGSKKTLYNKIKFAFELRLLRWQPKDDRIFLSEQGKEYVALRDVAAGVSLSEGQVRLLRRFVMQNPFESPVVLGIASVVEACFSLAKNTYPIPMQQLLVYFSYHAGKFFDWRTDKAKYNATKMYSNYAIDLGLLGESGDTLYITPEGFRFTIQMQLHKSLRMVDSLNLTV